MTLKQQENIRLVLFIAAYSSSFLSSMNGNEINTILSNYNLNIDDIRKNLFLLEDLAVLGAGWMEFITKEHHLIEEKYKNIIHNISSLFKTVEVSDNPVKSFALYVYLYRNGFLSCNHKFSYSFECKDLARLTGADVVNGRTVCRGIASMFTDICRETGMDASNVSVRVNPKNFNGQKELCPTELNTGKSSVMGDLIGKVSQFIPLANHLITHLSFKGIRYDFDPTNDILLTERNRRLYISDSEEYYVSHDRIWGFIPFLLGQTDNDIRCMLNIKDANLPTIGHDEYVRLYSETLDMIKNNLDLFEKFYNDNKETYLDMASTLNAQHSLIKRYIPILPVK